MNCFKQTMIAFLGMLLPGAFAEIDNAEMEIRANQLWDHAVKTWRSPRTGIFYCKSLKDLPKAKEYPTPEQYRKGDYVARGVKKNGKWVVWNIAGGGSGTEDCSLFNGPLLAAMCDKYLVTKDPVCKEQAKMVYQGCISLATAHGEKGFIARGICHEDGKSFFPETSRDQYTNVMWGLWRYYHSELSTEAERDQIRQIFTDIVEKMIREVTKETDYNFQYPYGVKGYKTGVHSITRMYDLQGIGPDPVLTMMFAAAYDVSGKKEYGDRFVKALPNAIRIMKNEPDKIRSLSYISPNYCVNQNGYKWRMIYEITKDPKMKSAVLEVFTKYADFIAIYHVGKRLEDFRGTGEVYGGLVCCPGWKLTDKQLAKFRYDFGRLGAKGWPSGDYAMLATYWAARANGYFQPGADKNKNIR